jgi:hypothetical protein
MAEQQKSSSWWQTAPGMLTALAAFMAALTGLLGGLNQAGLLDRFKRPSTAPTQSAAAPRQPDSVTGTLGAEGRSAPPQPRSAVRPSTRITSPPKKSTTTPVRPPPPAPPASSSRKPGDTVRTPPAADTTAPAGGADTAAATRGSDTAAPTRSADTTAKALPPPAPPTAPAPAPAPGPVSGALPRGTVLELAAGSRICSTTNQPGDRFTAAVVVPVVGSNGLVLPVGTPVILEVLHLQAPAFIGARADTLSFGGRAYPLSSGNARAQRELVAGAAERGVALGACIPAGGRITATLDAAITVGQQP